MEPRASNLDLPRHNNVSCSSWKNLPSSDDSPSTIALRRKRQVWLRQSAGSAGTYTPWRAERAGSCVPSCQHRLGRGISAVAACTHASVPKDFVVEARLARIDARLDAYGRPARIRLETKPDDRHDQYPTSYPKTSLGLSHPGVVLPMYHIFGCLRATAVVAGLGGSGWLRLQELQDINRYASHMRWRCVRCASHRHRC